MIMMVLVVILVGCGNVILDINWVVSEIFVVIVDYDDYDDYVEEKVDYDDYGEID